jgi:hypothetical protein
LSKEDFDEFKSLYEEILSVLLYKNGDEIKNRFYGTDDTLKRLETAIQENKDDKYSDIKKFPHEKKKLIEEEQQFVSKLLGGVKPKKPVKQQPQESSTEPEQESKPEPVVAPTRQLSQSEVDTKLKTIAEGEDVADVSENVQKAIRKCLGIK